MRKRVSRTRNFLSLRNGGFDPHPSDSGLTISLSYLAAKRITSQIMPVGARRSKNSQELKSRNILPYLNDVACHLRHINFFHTTLNLGDVVLQLAHFCKHILRHESLNLSYVIFDLFHFAFELFDLLLEV